MALGRGALIGADSEGMVSERGVNARANVGEWCWGMWEILRRGNLTGDG